MTIIQASICADQKAIILIADRMVTVSSGGDEYETETSSSKVIPLGPFGIGCAGDFDSITLVMENIQIKDKLSQMADQISKFIKKKNEQKVQEYVKNKTLLEYKQFQDYVSSDQGKIPQKIIDEIYEDLEEVKIDCACLLIGFEDHHPRIIAIDEDGEISNNSEYYHKTIGSGQMFSEITFDIGIYNPKCSLEQGLFIAFDAKKSAEAHPGVGKFTDILILQENKPPEMIKNESAQMVDYNRNYEEYLKERKSLKEKYQPLFKVSMDQ
jgi:hypothetical protein